MSENKAGFEDYFRRDFVPLTRWMIFSGATMAEAQDAIQVAMLAAYGCWAAIDAPRAFVRTVALRHFRKERARAQRAQDAAAHVSELYATPHFEFRAEVETVRRALAALPAAQRHAIALTIDGYSPAEIAGILAQPAATVRSNLRHARKALRRQLGRGYDRVIREEAHDGP
ncbi:RNA polymerase sigma factor [Cryptosporangium aurantiacum]|uniref:RNA polymerase sigma-70 factor, ECF subfamily n=1 Tax=Cryptosporangium aurantiacum TaxID=134849 RepID=A0A1M7M779_9ACTN|nr:sigma-70 family RNA polymerase sigma factor [Cryptosporangium aurantiacum]SHM86506.1 RNA polymerase sigma-70 factor, ECF subfamily [Cryptosporangium aurantiacum]